MEFRPGRNVVRNNQLVMQGGRFIRQPPPPPVRLEPKTPEGKDCRPKK